MIFVEGHFPGATEGCQPPHDRTQTQALAYVEYGIVLREVRAKVIVIVE
jgi:hypothetical protein